MAQTLQEKRYWWKSPPEELAKTVWQHLNSLAQWRALFLQQRAGWTALFERESWVPRIGTFLGGDEQNPAISLFQRFGIEDSYSASASMNALKSTIEYVGSRLFDEMDTIEISPHNATHEVAEQAKQWTNALDATMNTPARRQVLRRCGMTGLKLGWAGILPEVIDGELKYSLVNFYDCWWDPRDAREGTPQSFHIARKWSRSELIAHTRSLRYEQIEERRDELIDVLIKIPEATDYGPQAYGQQGIDWTDPYDRHMQNSEIYDQSDKVWVVQSWRLPGGKQSPEYDGRWTEDARTILSADSGRYTVTVHGGSGPTEEGYQSLCLLDTGWTRMSFPVAWWTPAPHEKGIDGIALSATMEPFQRQIDLIWGRFHELFRDLGDTKVIIPKQGKDQKENVSANGITFVEAPAGAMRPTDAFVVVPQSPVSEQQWRYLDYLRDMLRQENGVNPQGIAGGTSRGANAPGIALLEEESKQDVSLAHVDWQWGHMLLDLGMQTIYALNDAAACDKSFKVPFEDEAGNARSARWADLTKGIEEWHLQFEPVGPLGKTKSGRIQRLIEYGRFGIVPSHLAAEYLRKSPDVKRMLREANSGELLVEWQLTGLSIPDRKPEEYAEFWPDENTPFDLGVVKAVHRLQVATRQGVTPETRERIDTYIAACEDMKRQQEEQIAAQVGPAGLAGTAPAAPMVPGVGVEAAAEPGVPDLPPLPM